MNIADLFRQTWQITWRYWQLWVLNLLLFLAFVPAVTLSGALGGLPGFLAVPVRGAQSPWLMTLRHTPAWLWVLAAGMALVLLVATSAVTSMLQAAAIRGAAWAAERGTFRLGQALDLGRQRVLSIIKLSLTFGLLIAAVGLLPPLVSLLLADRFDFGMQLLQTIQAGLIPLNAALGIGLLLVMMAVALEELRPRAAFRQAWRVFRSGWWAFLLVVGLSAVPGFAVALLLVPLIVVIPLFILSPQLGAALLVAYCAVTGPIGLVLMLFTAVFTVVLYTLIYRAAAGLARPAAPPAAA